MEFIEILKGILTEPSKTFDALKEESIGEALKYYAVFVAISSAIYAVMFSLFFGMMLRQFGTMMGMGTGVAAGVAMFFMLFIFGIIGVIIVGSIFHIFVYIAGGRKGLNQTIKAVIYGSTPGMLLGWIPLVGIIAGIWSLILEVLGIRQLHEMTTERAILAVVLVFVVSVIIAVILAVVIAAFIFSMRSTSSY